MSSKKALVVVDIQNDFCPGGALGVNEGDKVVPVMNQYIDLFSKERLPIFISRDWHPAETRHFKAFGGVWPPHCIRNSPGAAFHPGLRIPGQAIILSKGTDPGQDGYSVFDARDANQTSFLELLKELGVTELYIGGLATDYCVKATSLDALKKGFRVNILTDAIRGVNEDDSKRAIEAIVTNHGRLRTFAEVSQEFAT